jgi:hypothetical protein
MSDEIPRAKVTLLLESGTVELDLRLDSGQVCMTCGQVGTVLSCGHEDQLDAARVLASAYGVPLSAALR